MCSGRTVDRNVVNGYKASACVVHFNVDGNATIIIGWTTISSIFKRLYIEKNEKNMNNTLASWKAEAIAREIINTQWRMFNS